MSTLHTDFAIKKLWPSQVSGIAFLESRSAILGDEVGLGKTLQAIRAAQQIQPVENNGAAPHPVAILVICPLNLRANLKNWWAQEITGEEMTQLGAPSDRHVVTTELVKNTPIIKVYDGPGYEENLIRVWVIGHYEQLTKRHSVHKLLRERKWDAVIADEVHKAKNAKAQRTQGLWALKARFKWGLTGTPVAEFPPDLWALLHRVAPDEFPSYWSFVHRFTYPDYGRFGTRGRKAKDLEGLQRRTRPHLLVRRREDAGIELPPLVMKVEQIEMPEEQQKFYEHAEITAILETTDSAPNLTGPQMFNFAAQELSSKVAPIVISNAMARFTRLHQIASEPKHFKEITGGKEEWLKEFVLNGGGPAVVMTRYVRATLTIREVLDDLKSHPDVPPNYDPDEWVVGTYTALSEGHNLQRFNQLVAWDSTWARLSWEQALGRIRRPGQLRNMTVYRLIAKGTVDNQVRRAIDRKMSEVEMVIDWLRGKRDAN